MKTTKPIHVKQESATQNQQRQANASSWSQWGKVAVVFTVATGTYVLSKVMGLVLGSSYAQTFPSDTQAPSTHPSLITWPDAQSLAPAHAPTLDWQYENSIDGQASPFITLSALALSAPRYPLIGLSTLGLSFMQYFPKVEAVFPATLDLANLTDSEGFVLQGAVADDTGISVSAAGDVNGDGLADVLVGARYANPLGRTDAGAAYLLFGTNGSWSALVDLGNLTSSQGVVLQGAAAFDETGRSVNSAGDVNGDGLVDLLVGAYGADPLGRTDAGVAYLLFGTNGSWPAVVDLGSLTPSQGVVLQGAAADDFTGNSVSSAGDVNSDGLADVLVGAHLAHPLGRSNAGVAYLLFGTNGSWPAVVDLGSLTSSQGVVLQGAGPDDRTGWSASAAGDVNGDGLADVLVGAYWADPLGRTDAGVAYLIFGTNGSWPAVVDLGSLASSQGVVLQGAAADDRTGYFVSSAGDVNGDNLSDVLVGAYGADPLNRTNAGVAYLLFGTNGSWPALVDLGNLTNSQGVVLQGAVVGDNTGVSVSGAGDVNGDNLSDVLVGAPYADPLGRSTAGVVYLLFGTNGSWPAVVDLRSLTSSQGVVLQGAAASDFTGNSVSTAGDVNGDGLADMLVGARGADPLGRTYMIVGQRSLLPNPALTLPTNTSPAPSALTSTPSSSTALVTSTTTALSSQPVLSVQASHATTGALTQNNPGFSIYSNSILYAEIGVEVIITTDNLSVEGFTGDPNQLIFTIPENPAYTVTVNGEEQNSFPLWAIQQGFVGLTLGDDFCFEDFNEIPVQATDGRSTADFNLVFQGDTAPCGFNDASTLNVRPSLQGAAMLLVSSGLGLLASKQRGKSKSTETKSKLLTNNCDDTVEMKLSK